MNLSNVEVEIVRQISNESVNPKIDTLISTGEKNKDTDFAQVSFTNNMKAEKQNIFTVRFQVDSENSKLYFCYFYSS